MNVIGRIIILLFLFPGPVWGSMYFEPAVNLIGGGEYKLGITESKEIYGANFGLSLYKMFNKKLTVGVQGKQDLLVYVLENRDATTNVSAMGTIVGARIGLVFPGFHIWYVHGMIASLKENYQESADNISVAYTGEGFGLGVSLWNAKSLVFTITLNEYYYKDYSVTGVFPRIGSFEDRHLRLTYGTIGFGMPLGPAI